MWIKRAVFKNFGPHAHLDLSLGHGLIGILGRNGCGKSTITDGLYAALTNDFGRFDGVKQDCIRSTAGEKEESSIYLEIEHNGSTFKLLRGLRPARNELVIDGEKPILKANDIQTVLFQRLGIDHKLMDRYVFVRQWDMFSFMSDTPGDRAKTYQHLCGTGKAQMIHEAIDAMLKSDKALAVDPDDNSDEFNQRAAAARAELETTAASLEETSEQLLSSGDVAKYQQVTRNWNTQLRLNEELVALQPRHDELQLGESDLESALERQVSLAEDLRGVVEGLKPDADASQVLLGRLESWKKVQARREELNQQKQRLDADFKSNPEPAERGQDDHREELRNELAELRSTVSRNKKILDAFDRDGVVECPTCGTSVSEMDDHLKELRSQLLSAQAAAAKLTTDLESAESVARKVRQWEAWHIRYEEQVRAHTRAVEDLDEIEDAPAADEEELRQIISDYKLQVANLAAADKLVTDTKLKLGRVQAALAEVTRQIDDNRNNLAAVKTTSEANNEANNKLSLHLAATNKTAVLNERSSRLTREIDQCNKELAAIATRLARGKKARRFVRELEAIQSVFHRQALPQDVAQQNLVDMEADINKVLDLFGSPFWVETSDDLSFIAHFPGEPGRAAGRLSGGQKGVLAVAFRTAISSMFSSDIGLMVLDEPTAGMDDENVSYLAQAMSSFAATIKGRRQVIIITHAEGLNPSFEQVIDVGTYSAANQDSNQVTSGA